MLDFFFAIPFSCTLDLLVIHCKPDQNKTVTIQYITY